MSEQNFSASQIRQNIGTSISKDTLYGIRRNILKKSVDDEYQSFAISIQKWKNWHTSISFDDKSFYYSHFVSIRAISNSIILHTLFMDDTYCANFHSFPLFIILGIDQNNYTQLVAFAILRNSTTSVISKFLTYFRSKLIIYPKAFVVDRNQSQMELISNIFPNSKIIFCSKHLASNIRNIIKNDFLQNLF
jgi:hypothetical protein